jgi:hypothetical protein
MWGDSFGLLGEGNKERALKSECAFATADCVAYMTP